MIETTALPTRIHPGQLVHKDPTQELYRVVADFPQFSKEYFVSERGRRAAVLALRGEDVLLVRQYRLLINTVSLEVPGGRVDDGESFEGAAVRECLEETGVRCEGLRPLIAFQQGLDTINNYTQVFYATVTEDAGGTAADARTWIPFARCVDMIFQQEIQDSLSIIALLAYQVKIGVPR